MSLSNPPRIRLVGVVLLAVALLSRAMVSFGDDSGAVAKAQSPKPQNARKQRLPGVTPAREAAVMTFVEQHHPELRELLINLKQNDPKQYDLAIRDLFRTTERLAQAQEKDDGRYDHELKLWKVQSRIQLLTARLKMSESPELYEQLEQTLTEQFELQIAALRQERVKLSDRTKKLDEQLARMERDRNGMIQRQLTNVKSARKGRDKASKAKVSNP